MMGNVCISGRLPKLGDPFPDFRIGTVVHKQQFNIGKVAVFHRRDLKVVRGIKDHAVFCVFINEFRNALADFKHMGNRISAKLDRHPAAAKAQNSLQHPYDHKEVHVRPEPVFQIRCGSFKAGLQDNSAVVTRMHTATHLLHAALHKVLGPTANQKGSNITAERLRFDFTWPEKMTDEQIKATEDMVNQWIKDAIPVTKKMTTVEEAKAEGAMALFGSKYGDQVSLYSIGDISKEICCGPHVENTSELGSFKIQKEQSSSAGVRRIKAVIGNLS